MKIAMLGEEHTVTWPDWATREELALAYGTYGAGELGQRLRICAAAIVLCSRVGRRLNLRPYAESGCNPLLYGGVAWQRLREEQETNDNIMRIGMNILDELVAVVWPREVEVKAAQDFTRAEEPRT